MPEIRKLFRMSDRLVVSLPLSFTRLFHWAPGDHVTFEAVNEQTIVLRRITIPRASEAIARERRPRV